MTPREKVSFEGRGSTCQTQIALQIYQQPKTLLDKLLIFHFTINNTILIVKDLKLILVSMAAKFISDSSLLIARMYHHLDHIMKNVFRKLG